MSPETEIGRRARELDEAIALCQTGICAERWVALVAAARAAAEMLRSLDDDK